jgi:predicted metal-dependent peptidase
MVSLIRHTIFTQVKKMTEENDKKYETAVRLGLSPSKARLEIVAEEPFYGQILMCLDIKETSQADMPTAGVYWNKSKGRFGMMYDRELFAWLTKLQQKAIFIHEFLHIAFGHLTIRGGGQDASPQEHKLWNIAMDLAINSWVKDLPHNIIFPHLAAKQQEQELASKAFTDALLDHFTKNPDEVFEKADGTTISSEDVIKEIERSKAEMEEAKQERIKLTGERPPGLLSLVMPGDGLFKNYPPFLTCEQYYMLMVSDPQMKEAIEKMYGSGADLFDSHKGQGKEEGEGKAEGEGEGKAEGEGFETASKQAEAKRITERARNNSSKKSWGNVSADLSEYINSLLETTIPWQAALRYFVLKSRRGNNYSTYRRTNRRIRNELGESLAPGRKTHRTSNVLVAMDESGSVSDNLMGEFIAELNGLSKHVTFTMLPFDTEVGEPWEWKKGKNIRTVERTKQGGTDFNAPTEYFNKNKQYDGLIILTDMYAPIPGACRSTRIWVTSTDKEYSEHVANGNPVIYIKED